MAYLQPRKTDLVFTALEKKGVRVELASEGIIRGERVGRIYVA